MELYSYILFIILIVLFWLLSGKYEWQPSVRLVKRIRRLSLFSKADKSSVHVIRLQTAKLNYRDIEEDIYRVKFGQPQKVDSVINMTVRLTDTALSAEEAAKIKLRLEERFSGLVVNFLNEEQGKKHESLCDC